jgi:hypothetical protein
VVDLAKAPASGSGPGVNSPRLNYRKSANHLHPYRKEHTHEDISWMPDNGIRPVVDDLLITVRLNTHRRPVARHPGEILFFVHPDSSCVAIGPIARLHRPLARRRGIGSPSRLSQITALSELVQPAQSSRPVPTSGFGVLP